MGLFGVVRALLGHPLKTFSTQIIPESEDDIMSRYQRTLAGVRELFKVEQDVNSAWRYFYLGYKCQEDTGLDIRYMY